MREYMTMNQILVGTSIVRDKSDYRFWAFYWLTGVLPLHESRHRNIPNPATQKLFTKKRLRGRVVQFGIFRDYEDSWTQVTLFKRDEWTEEEAFNAMDGDWEPPYHPGGLFKERATVEAKGSKIIFKQHCGYDV